MFEPLWLTQIVLTSALAGLIWIVQLVHYPSFAFVDRERFVEFHRHHTRSISWIVMPLMAGEGLVALYFTSQNLSFVAILNLISVVLIAAVTFFWSVPAHSRLALGFDVRGFQDLLRSNWVRTFLWTARLVFLLLST